MTVGEDDLGGVFREPHSFEALCLQCGPDRPSRHQLPGRQPGLDALAEDQQQSGDGLNEMDCTTGGLTERRCGY